MFYPTEENVSGIKDIASQSNLTIVCDNGSVENRLLFEGIPQCIYIFFNKNMGISGAFNFVLENPQYGWSDADYIIFFDQDSRIHSGYINKLIEEYERIEHEDIRIGCLGPNWLNSINGHTKYSQKSKQHFFEVDRIMTSSLICRYGNLKEIGFWNTKIFLDLADWDLCWRFRDYGKKCYITDNIILFHTIGNGEKKIGPLRIKEGNPIREYYQTRDCLKLITKNYTPLKYKVRFMIQVTVRPILHILFLSDPLIRARYIKKGFRDYFRGKDGNIDGE